LTAKRRLALRWLGRHRAADAAQEEQQVADALYGLIVGAAVMAASHAPGTGRVAVSVLVTLLVYWSAERYAAILAGRIAVGHRRPGSLRHELTDGWGLLTSSFIPIVVLLAFDLFGAGVRTAVLAALVCSTGLLCLAGLQIGTAGRLSTTERVFSATAAGSFGLVLIALKVALH
jgi:hypothetical protein